MDEQFRKDSKNFLKIEMNLKDLAENLLLLKDQLLLNSNKSHNQNSSPDVDSKENPNEETSESNEFIWFIIV